jgi:hypothetical protein
MIKNPKAIREYSPFLYIQASRYHFMEVAAAKFYLTSPERAKG